MFEPSLPPVREDGLRGAGAGFGLGGANACEAIDEKRCTEEHEVDCSRGKCDFEQSIVARSFKISEN